MTTPLKKDAGKPRFDLVPPRALEQVARVLEYGARKYAPNGWRRASAEWSRYLAAAYRHLNAWQRGEDTDPESGLPHLAHAACSLLFLGEYGEEKSGVDDRHKAVREVEEALAAVDAVEVPDLDMEAIYRENDAIARRAATDPDRLVAGIPYDKITKAAKRYAKYAKILEGRRCPNRQSTKTGAKCSCGKSH